jgi:hypothetical protein
VNEQPDRRRGRYLHTTQQAQDTDTCKNSGIRTSGSINRQAADLSHRDRLQLTIKEKEKQSLHRPGQAPRVPGR